MSDRAVVKLALGLDWQAGPFWLWRDEPLPEEFDSAEVTEVLELSESLIAEIIEWDSVYQAKWTLMMEDRPIFATEEDRLRFLAWGRVLARRVRAECPPEVTVTYSGDGSLDELIP
ncbi:MULTISPECIES: hypothetical protein [Actinoalloteichus]|uniref:Uncharacterized protein n=1 Tax=Actinoalloteichus fjordicus TaxID=1612552 RepID=A0AAC9PUA2_9PSEU|nr:MULTISPECIES: hypothetical protein [Actinoalloteichus]APU17479.1 hypothetical protein UA74_27380 [Actinoalloteichus fjordicus]APU23556.1 hypothetical protein UA75_27925 [Actinoalloteichus sp. GBA129-24]